MVPEQSNNAAITTGRRQKELARIHIMKKQLALDTYTYRAMLKGLTGKDSAGQMTETERRFVIAEMEKALNGGKMPSRGKGRFPGHPGKQTPSKDPLMRKIGAILAEEKKPWQYVHGMAKKMFKISLVQWCDTDQLWRIVGALEISRARKAKRAAGGAL